MVDFLYRRGPGIMLPETEGHALTMPTYEPPPQSMEPGPPPPELGFHRTQPFRSLDTVMTSAGETKRTFKPMDQFMTATGEAPLPEVPKPVPAAQTSAHKRTHEKPDDSYDPSAYWKELWAKAFGRAYGLKPAKRGG